MRLPDYLRSTPFRIGLTYAVAFSMSVALLFGVLYWSVTRDLTSELRATIEEDARPLVQAYTEGRILRLMEAVRERARAARPGETFVLLQAATGQVLEGNVSPTAPFRGWRELVAREAGGSAAGQPHRILALGIRLDSAFLLVGRSLNAVTQTQRLFVRSLAWTLAVTVLLAVGGGAVLGHGALRRIETINRTTQAIIRGELHSRIPIRDTSDELDRLAANINHMLDRIEELLEGLRQVTNDVAHDLRTPLGRLRQGLESARRREATVEGHKAALDRAIAETDTILDTFNALLRIAQIEAGARKAQFSDVDLSGLVHTVAEAYGNVAEDTGKRFVATIDDGVRVHGDRDLLTQMLANLVENAIHHCPAGADIAVTLLADAGGPLLAVADTGPGIPPEERDKVLKRFYRLEKSRTSPGSGLGLPLVKAVADLHGATLTLTDNRPGLRVEVRFAG
jgi:signal transduction histidine kinase